MLKAKRAEADDMISEVGTQELVNMKTCIFSQSGLRSEMCTRCSRREHNKCRNEGFGYRDGIDTVIAGGKINQKRCIGAHYERTVDWDFGH